MISFMNKCVSQCHTWEDEIRLTSIALFELNKDIILDANTPDELIVSGEYIGDLDGIIEIDEILPVEISSLVYGVSKKKSAQLPLKNITERTLTNQGPSNFDLYAKEQPEFFVILDEVISGMDSSHLDNAINHISKISKNNLIGDNLNLFNKIWARLGDTYLKRTQSENSFRNEVQILMDNCEKQAQKENIANKFIELFAISEKNQHKGEEWFVTYKSFDDYIKTKELNVQLPQKFLNADIFIDYIRSARGEYINYQIYCDNDELNGYCSSRIKDGVDLSDVIKLLKGDERYGFNELLMSARSFIESQSAKDENIESILNMCKVLSNGPLKLNIDLAYLDSFSHDGAVLYDLQFLRALKGKEITVKDDSFYANLAKLSYSYTDTYGIWEQTLISKTKVMKNIMTSLIMDNQHLGNIEKVKDVLTDMSNIWDLTNVEHRHLIRFVNDWGKNTLNDTESKVLLANVFKDEKWCKALLEEICPLSTAILEKFYQDFKSQPLTNFINSNHAWITLSNNYWLRVLTVLIDSDEFKQSCSDKLVEITVLLIEGICTGAIVERNENKDLQSKILEWTEFDMVSSKVIDMMGKFGGQLTINVFMFKSLHHYMEKTRGYETQFLNYVLKPIINNHEVQIIISDHRDFYEPMLNDNLDQASDLKKDLIRLYDNSTHVGFKSIIESLNILPKIDVTESVDVAS